MSQFITDKYVINSECDAILSVVGSSSSINASSSAKGHHQIHLPGTSPAESPFLAGKFGAGKAELLQVGVAAIRN